MWRPVAIACGTLALLPLACSGVPAGGPPGGEAGAPSVDDPAERGGPADPPPGLVGSERVVSTTEEPPPAVDPRDCASRVYGIARDFSDAHPDFEKFTGKAPSPGIVLPQLDADQRLVHTNDPALLTEGGGYLGPEGQQTAGATSFADWYADTEANVAYFIELTFVTNADGSHSFGGPEYFPLDDLGFGNQGREHNFHFTTELRVEFEYLEGASLTFTGDDDLWAFVNGHLVIDLGGLHSSYVGEVRLDDIADELGLELGQVYRLDLFHAERHTDQSNFRVDTTFSFTNCGVFVGLGE